MEDILPHSEMALHVGYITKDLCDGGLELGDGDNTKKTLLLTLAISHLVRGITMEFGNRIPDLGDVWPPLLHLGDA